MEHRTTVAESRHEPAIRRESLLRRRYVVPFLLACIILACNQATGINSIIGYNTNILIQAGLTDFQAHEGYLSFAMINFAMTVVGVLLVDRLGRKRLLSIGSAGIVISLLAVGVLFGQAQRNSHDCTAALRRMVHGQSLRVNFDSAAAARLLKESGFTAGNLHAQPVTLNVLYSYGGFTGTTRTVRSDSRPATLIHISRSADVPSNGVIAFFSNPSANLTAARKAPLKIDRAWITPIPSVFHGVLTLLVLLAFVSFFAAGPGVCVWLALSELMPTRIRSSGMSMALVINQSVSTLIAALFLPAVGRYGYADVFYLFAGCTVVYFITAAFFLPETRHKTLEEIERLFQEARTGNEVQPRGASDAI
jgi:MFS family permease